MDLGYKINEALAYLIILQKINSRKDISLESLRKALDPWSGVEASEYEIDEMVRRLFVQGFCKMQNIDSCLGVHRTTYRITEKGKEFLDNALHGFAMIQRLNTSTRSAV